MAAANVMERVTSRPVVAPMIWPKPRTWAAAQSTEPGTRKMTVSRSTPGEKRSRKKSPKVVRPRRQSGTAKNSPMMMMLKA